MPPRAPLAARAFALEAPNRRFLTQRGAFLNERPSFVGFGSRLGGVSSRPGASIRFNASQCGLAARRLNFQSSSAPAQSASLTARLILVGGTRRRRKKMHWIQLSITRTPPMSGQTAQNACEIANTRTAANAALSSASHSGAIAGGVAPGIALLPVSIGPTRLSRLTSA